MAEYISRENAHALLCQLCIGADICTHEGVCNAEKGLANIPAADVAEVRHGKWVWNGETCCNHCSVCGVGAMWFRIQMEYYYCPNCGAKMDESEDEK